MKTLIIVTLSLLSFNLFANVGIVTGFAGKASIERGDTTLPVALMEQIQKDDAIRTDAKSKVQITFADRTIVTIGQNSNFIVNEYLNDDTGNSKFEGSLTKGFMRTMSGKIGKLAPQRFKIKTKTATIGIRGTIFIVKTNDDGSITNVQTLQGQTTLTTDTGQTYNISQNQQLTYNQTTGEVTIEDIDESTIAETESNSNTNEETEEESTSEQNEDNQQNSSDENNSGVNNTDDTTEAVNNANQAATESNQTELTGDGDSIPQISTKTVNFSTTTAASRNDLIIDSEGSVTTFVKDTTNGADNLDNPDAPYVYGEWADDYPGFYTYGKGGFFAEGTVTQDTINAIYDARDQGITATYSASDTDMAYGNPDVSEMKLDITVDFGSGQVNSDLYVELGGGDATGNIMATDNINFQDGSFEFDTFSTSGDYTSANGSIEGQFVGTAASNGAPNGVTGIVNLTIGDGQGTFDVEASYGTQLE
jgi:hypothetical protein